MVFDKEHITALNGKPFALLTEGELEIVRHFRDQGRKKGIEINVGGRKDWRKSEERAIRNTNDRLTVVSLEY